MAPVRDRTLRLATGITTGCTDQGDPKVEPAVLLLHAWAGSRREFARLLPLLPASVHVAAVDLRGHGDADKPPGGYDLPSLALDVVAVLDALGHERAVLVGASSGGYVAQQVAVDAPGRVAGLVLAGTPRDISGRAPFADQIDRLSDPVDPNWARAFVSRFTDLTVLPSWYADLLVEDALRLPAGIWRATLDGLSSSPPPTDVGTVSAPALVVSGERDSALGSEQTRSLVAAIPGARWIEYPSTGHLVLVEQPERLAADIMAFLASLPA